MGAELRAEVRRQAPPEMQLPRTAQATLEVLDQFLRRIQAEDLMPVLVFDDTDRWFRKVGGRVDHRDLALTFVARVLPQLRERPASLVVAAHDSYLADPDLSAHLRRSIEIRIDVPKLASPAALGRVLHSRVVAHTSPDDPEAVPDLDAVLTAGGLGRLFELYVGAYDGALRDVIQTMHVAVTDACAGGFDRVTSELVDQAVW